MARNVRVSRAGSLLTIDLSGLDQIAKGLAKSAPEVRKALKEGLERGARAVADDARALSSWSDRIPGSIRTEVRGIRSKVIAGNAEAPHAAAFENRGVPGFFRHPVFGRPGVGRAGWTWVTQGARPFMRPAAEANAPRTAAEVMRTVGDVIDRALAASSV